jgi:hypothetical protein
MSRFSFEFFEGVRGKGQPKVRGGVKAARIVERWSLSTDGLRGKQYWPVPLNRLVDDDADTCSN